MSVRSALLTLSLVLLTAPLRPAGAQTLPAPDRADGPWTVKDVLKQRSLSGVDISPDGERVLWVKTTPDFEKDRDRHDLYLTYRNDPLASDESAADGLPIGGSD